MTIKTVMVYVDPEQQAEAQVHIARSLATRFDSSIVGVSSFAVEPDVVAEGVMVPQMTEEELKQKREELAAKQKWFQEIAALPNEKVEWRWKVEYPTTFLTEEARSADVVVLQHKQGKADRFRLVDSTEAIFRMGRPTILVPEGVDELRADRIVLGWKDTRESRLAVLNSLPFLIQASQVTVTEICTSGEQDKARRRVRDVADYLLRHGAKCRPEVRVHTAEPDSDHLIRLARNDGADLIVTGAYGHSRLGEWVFGGMTRDLIEDSPYCLLMSH
jgi:nucleotide-binding universal stress UspA family protein